MTDIPTWQRKPRRISITIPWHLAERLQTMADRDGRSLSNVCAYLLEVASSGGPLS